MSLHVYIYRRLRLPVGLLNFPRSVAGGVSMLAVALTCVYWMNDAYRVRRSSGRIRENIFLGNQVLFSDCFPPYKCVVCMLIFMPQLGLVAVAIFVTRSSALSLQSKQGLPRGNQVVGWLVLGMSLCLWSVRLIHKHVVYQMARRFIQLLLTWA